MQSQDERLQTRKQNQETSEKKSEQKGKDISSSDARTAQFISAAAPLQRWPVQSSSCMVRKLEWKCKFKYNVKHKNEMKMKERMDGKTSTKICCGKNVEAAECRKRRCTKYKKIIVNSLSCGCTDRHNVERVSESDSEHVLTSVTAICSHWRRFF